MTHQAPRGAALSLALFLATIVGPVPVAGQETLSPAPETDLVSSTSGLRDLVARYSVDRSGLGRRWNVEYSVARRERMQAFYEGWLHRLDDVDFETLGAEGRIDYVLLRNELVYRLARLERETTVYLEMENLLPVAGTIAQLEEDRRRMEGVDPRQAAATLDELASLLAAARAGLGGENPSLPAPIVAFRAAGALEDLGERLEDWHSFYSGYDPLFSWWTRTPYERVVEEFTAYREFLRERIVGVRDGEDEPIVGDPIGADAIDDDLTHEMLAYTPAELIAIAEREYAWCVAQMEVAAAELGYGDDWHAALEHVKTLHLEPGQQPSLVRDLAVEAIAFLRERDLVTVPPLAEEIWRMEMLSRERQKVAPFFLGGEVVQVAFPTDEMTQDEKLMSLRANNVHFSRAVVHHELIPGHHLQGFMTSRFNTQRRAFSTPFWGEGWALYWEMRLWDLGFATTPEDRVGMLFWRMHRAARIIFSLQFHLGEMTADEAIDFLVDGVGHERASATAEVRRSFNGSYPPLYQAAYMIGGLQILSLWREVVETGRMSERDFHDAILKGGSMPIEMVRARILGEPPARDHSASWRFASP